MHTSIIRPGFSPGYSTVRVEVMDQATGIAAGSLYERDASRFVAAYICLATFSMITPKALTQLL